MRNFYFLLIFCTFSLPLFSETGANRLAHNAEEQLPALLNKPAMVKPVTADPLGKNWFRLETDAHVFSDQVSVKQVAAVLNDIDNQHKYFNGKRSKLTEKTVSREGDETIIDSVSTSVVAGIKFNTPYRAVVKFVNAGTVYAKNFVQMDKDSEDNKEIKNLFAQRYAEEVTIHGKKYTYIRMHTISDVNASILPGAKGTLEKNAGPTVIEALEALIAAAKTK
jgi:hypothetical protein